MATVKELRSQAKARKVKNYSRMGKAQLLSALGQHEEARAHKSAQIQRKAAAFHAAKAAEAAGGNDARRAGLKATVKSRLLRGVKRDLQAHEQKMGRPLTQDEKRQIAAKALAGEAKAIKSGKPEQRGKSKGKPIEKMSLQELFTEADRIGSKYQDGTTSLDAHRKAGQILAESGMTDLVKRSAGRRLSAIDGGKGKTKGEAGESKVVQMRERKAGTEGSRQDSYTDRHGDIQPKGKVRSRPSRAAMEAMEEREFGKGGSKPASKPASKSLDTPEGVAAALRKGKDLPMAIVKPHLNHPAVKDAMRHAEADASRPKTGGRKQRIQNAMNRLEELQKADLKNSAKIHATAHAAIATLAHQSGETHHVDLPEPKPAAKKGKRSARKLLSDLADNQQKSLRNDAAALAVAQVATNELEKKVKGRKSSEQSGTKQLSAAKKTRKRKTQA